MLELLLIDVALCAALMMVAALVLVRRRRRSRGQAPVPASGRGAAARLAGEAMAPRGIAIVPGFSDTVQRDRGSHVPTQRGRRPRNPGRWPAAAGAVTTSEQIASYYAQADQPMADYLAALGWTQEIHSPEPPVRWSARQDPPPSGDNRQ